MLHLIIYITPPHPPLFSSLPLLQLDLLLVAVHLELEPVILTLHQLFLHQLGLQCHHILLHIPASGAEDERGQAERERRRERGREMERTVERRKKFVLFLLMVPPSNFLLSPSLLPPSLPLTCLAGSSSCLQPRPVCSEPAATL